MEHMRNWINVQWRLIYVSLTAWPYGLLIRVWLNSDCNAQVILLYSFQDTKVSFNLDVGQLLCHLSFVLYLKSCELLHLVCQLQSWKLNADADFLELDSLWLCGLPPISLCTHSLCVNEKLSVLTKVVLVVVPLQKTSMAWWR